MTVLCPFCFGKPNTLVVGLIILAFPPFCAVGVSGLEGAPKDTDVPLEGVPNTDEWDFEDSKGFVLGFCVILEKISEFSNGGAPKGLVVGAPETLVLEEDAFTFVAGKPELEALGPPKAFVVAAGNPPAKALGAPKTFAPTEGVFVVVDFVLAGAAKGLKAAGDGEPLDPTAPKTCPFMALLDIDFESVGSAGKAVVSEAGFSRTGVEESLVEV